LDPAYAPGTGTPVPGGLTSAQALQIIRKMGTVNLVGCDVVEVAPAYDQSDITAIAAAHIACDLLCVLRNKKLGIA
jgi:agmatinase